MSAEGVRVLYVDDDAGTARLVERALGRRGFAVEHVPNGEAALKRLAAGGIDAIALDHYMPGATGLDLLGVLKEHDDAPPVVYVTASGDTGLAVAALKAGAADYVPKDVAGDFLELLASAIDGALEQTRLKREKAAAEEAVREQRDRAEMLLREMNHRIGNSLALVAALVRIQANALRDPGAISALKETQTRISAIASLHKQLYTSGDVRFVEIGSFLTSLARELETAMRAEGRAHPVHITAESFLMPTDKAVSIGVVANELLTNAYKYAYPEGAEGEIRIRIGAENGTANLRVEDDGVGWRGQGAAVGTGLGSQIVKAMASNLRAELAFDPVAKGTRVSLSFPL
jgi:two-component sensor histidine kinase